jgi:hypothetical protein
MNQRMVGLVCVCVAVLTMGCGGGGAAEPAPAPATTGGTAVAAQGGSLQVNNGSSYAIHYLYMSSTAESTWGPDQLGSSVIGAGESFTLSNVPCGNYDVKLVDEDGDECELRNVYLCADAALNITNDALLQCEGYR